MRIIPPDFAELTTRIPEIDLPTLLLWGRRDWVVPLDVAERLVTDLPSARLEIMENCGHVPPEECRRNPLRSS